MNENERFLLGYELRNIALSRNLFQTLNLENYSFLIMEKIYTYIDNIPSVNEFYRALKNILNTQIILGNFIAIRLSYSKDFNDDTLGSYSSMFR